MPAPAPRPVTTAASASNRLRRFAAPAPSARRTASSLRRVVSRTSSRLTTLASATSSTKPTAPQSATSAGRTLPVRCSRSGMTLAPRFAFSSGWSAASCAAIVLISASAAATVARGARRPTTIRKWLLRLARSSGVQANGARMSVVRSGNANSGGSTPTISVGRRSRRTTRPMTLGSPPKRDCQRRWLIIATRPAESWSSPGRNARPSSGRVPSTLSRSAVQDAALISSGWPAPVSERLPPVIAAIDWKLRARAFQSK